MLRAGGSGHVREIVVDRALAGLAPTDGLWQQPALLLMAVTILLLFGWLIWEELSGEDFCRNRQDMMMLAANVERAFRPQLA